MPAAAKRKPVASQQPITLTLPELAAGERYAGPVIDENGKPTHHLILLPGCNEKATWKQAGEWAKKQGGALPDRQEAALLYANCKPHVEAGWYWTSEQYADDASYAWVQSFGNGGQTNTHKGSVYRVRAVRRVIIQ